MWLLSFIVLQIVKKTMLFIEFFANYTSVSLLIQNSIPMGIEVQNKKIPLPWPAPQVLLLHQVEVPTHKVEALLTQSRSSTRRASRGSEA